MAGKSSLNDDDYISDINVTPLVDVVLVLLVIFLITAPTIYQSAIKVKLPKASTAEGMDQKNRLRFTLSASGEIRWNEDRLDWVGLEARLKDNDATIDKNQNVVINADQDTPHGTVIKLMDILRNYGLTHFALSVER